MAELFRYMSTAEKKYLENGTIVNNHTDWHELRGTASTSKGFTFGIGGLKKAIERSRQLKGIVHADWLMIAELKDMPIESLGFKACKGRYKNYSGLTPRDVPDNPNLIPDEYVDELCIEQYSTDFFASVKFYPVRGVDFHSQTFIVGMRKMVGKKEKWLLQVCNNQADYDRYKLATLHGYERGGF